LARLVPGDLDLAASDRPADRCGEAICGHARAEPAQRVEERRDRTLAQALGAGDRDGAAPERGQRRTESGDGTRISGVDGAPRARPRAGPLNDDLVGVALDAVLQCDDGIDHRPHIVARIEWPQVQARAAVGDRR
jgi:hypothetical protein